MPLVQSGIEVQTTEEEREAQIRELERATSTGAGWNSKAWTETNNFSWKKYLDNIKSSCRLQRDLPFKGGKYYEIDERSRLGDKKLSRHRRKPCAARMTVGRTTASRQKNLSARSKDFSWKKTVKFTSRSVAGSFEREGRADFVLHGFASRRIYAD